LSVTIIDIFVDIQQTACGKDNIHGMNNCEITWVSNFINISI